MARKRLSKTVHYKRALVKADATLQQYLERVLVECPKPLKRKEAFAGDDGPIRLIGSWRRSEGMVFGHLMQYESGRDQMLITLDEDVDDIPIETVAVAQDDAGRQREVMDSVLYFCISGNHVVVLQSQALKARQLESHIWWLFGERTGVVPDDTEVTLSDHPSEKAQQAIAEKPAKTVSIGSPVKSEENKDDEVEDDGAAVPGEAKSVTWRPTGRAADLLAAVFGEEWRKRARLEESLDDANLQVQLRITYLRKTSDAGHRMLDELARAGRHMEPDDVRIDLVGGGKITGSDIKLSGTVNVDSYNGVLDSSDLYSAMREWLRDMIEQGKIQ